MYQDSTLNLECAVFRPDSISEDTHKFNHDLVNLMAKGPKWYEVGAETYRQMRLNGETPIPRPQLLASATVLNVPSKDPDRMIPCRVFQPNADQPLNGTFMHIHGGGWVLQSESSQDAMLQEIATSSSIVVISVGYRLAPEYAYPAGPQDCFDVATWLYHHSNSKFGSPFCFIGGESAGAHLSMLVALHLLGKQEEFPDLCLRGLILNFGVYDLSLTPSVYNFTAAGGTLVLDKDLLDRFIEAFLPNATLQDRKDPSISPLYANLELFRGRLPPVLFTCGTQDCLLDDTMFMSTRWIMAGGRAKVVIVPGAPHGYILYPREIGASGASIGLDAISAFVREVCSPDSQALKSL